MAKGCTNNTYEEARKQRLEENKKRFEDLGISTISKNLTEITSPARKTPHHPPKLKSKTNGVVEPRRSSRVRNPVPSYRDDVSIDLPPLRKRSRSNSSSWGSYIARPLDEIKEATEEQRIRALEAAEELQTNLQSTNPSFIKSMVRSHVYSCFWLALPSKFCEEQLPKTVYDMILEDENGLEYETVYIGKRSGLSGGWRAFALDHKLDDGDALPSKFCEEQLPKTVYDMILEDENGLEYETVYIGKRSGLSGGWRAFALDHKLDDGDALVFELIEAARFKIYIVKAFPDSIEEDGKEILEEEGNMRATKAPRGGNNVESESKKTKKPKQTIVHETNESASSQEHLPESSIENEDKPRVNPTKKTKISQKKMQKKSKRPATGESKGEAQVETAKPKATLKPKPQANKTQAKKNEFVQDAGMLKKVEPVEEASRCVSQNPRKKPAPKFFRKKA